MKNIYFTVGPTQLYPTTATYIQQALTEDILSISHRGKKFMEIYKETSDNLRQLLNIPSTHHIFFTGSSTESMERIIANTVEQNSLHIITGEFSKKFYQNAVDLNKKPITFTISKEKDFTLNNLIVAKNTELICVTENDTSIGMRIPLNDFSNIKKTNPSVLFAVDVVSSMPYVEIDYSVFDMVFFSVQKGFGLPAGLGVLIISDAAIEKTSFLVNKHISVGNTEFSFLTFAYREKNYLTPGTPNVLDIYLLGKVANDLNSIGMKKIRKETESKAQLIYDYFDHESMFKPLINNFYRSVTTPVINVDGKADEIASKLADQGYIISKGYRQFEKEHIRIANFPVHSITNVKNLISVLKTNNI